MSYENVIREFSKKSYYVYTKTPQNRTKTPKKPKNRRKIHVQMGNFLKNHVQMGNFTGIFRRIKKAAITDTEWALLLSGLYQWYNWGSKGKNLKPKT